MSVGISVLANLAFAFAALVLKIDLSLWQRFFVGVFLGIAASRISIAWYKRKHRWPY